MPGCGAPPAANNANANARPANTANTNTASDAATAEAEIKKLMDTTQAALAKNDADAMDKVYGDSYMLVNVDGSVHNKAERLAALRSGEVKYTSFAYNDVTTRVNPDGNSAVVISRLAMKGTFKGKSIDGDHRVLGLYSKTKDGWRLVAASGIPITASAASSATTANAASNSNAAANTARPPAATS